MPEIKNSTLFTLFVSIISIFIPSLTFAHHAEFMQNEPFVQGLSMPMHGIDHMIFTIAVGLIAAKIGGKALWSIPLVFTVAIVLGSALNASGIAIPLIEYGIVASLLVCAALLSFHTGLSLALTVGVIAAFTVLQGNALTTVDGFVHNIPYFIAGSAISALILLGIGIGLGLLVSRINISIFRYLGIVLLIGAVTLFVYPDLNGSIMHYLEA
jgi:urease accessory protein